MTCISDTKPIIKIKVNNAVASFISSKINLYANTTSVHDATNCDHLIDSISNIITLELAKYIYDLIQYLNPSSCPIKAQECKQESELLAYKYRQIIKAELEHAIHLIQKYIKDNSDSRMYHIHNSNYISYDLNRNYI